MCIDFCPPPPPPPPCDETPLFGGPGNDNFIGDSTCNEIHGGVGNDTLIGLGGDDDLIGDSGNDLLLGGTGVDFLNGGIGNDTLRGGPSYDDLLGGTGDDSLRGGLSADTLWGETGDDTLRGGKGRDELEGGSGNDVLFGGRGADNLDGGPGADTLTGGAGADHFIFTSPQEGSDLITDFHRAEGDLVELNGGPFTTGFQWGSQRNGVSHAHTTGAITSRFLLAANNLTNLTAAVKIAASGLGAALSTSVAYFYGLTTAQHHLYYIVANHVSGAATTLNVHNLATLAGITGIGTGATQIDASDIILF